MCGGIKAAAAIDRVRPRHHRPNASVARDNSTCAQDCDSANSSHAIQDLEWSTHDSKTTNTGLIDLPLPWRIACWRQGLAESANRRLATRRWQIQHDDATVVLRGLNPLPKFCLQTNRYCLKTVERPTMMDSARRFGGLCQHVGGRINQNKSQHSPTRKTTHVCLVLYTKCAFKIAIRTLQNFPRQTSDEVVSSEYEQCMIASKVGARYHYK